MELLELLLNNTKLVQFGTGRGEHLLQFLCQTVARQIVEQDEMKKFKDDTPSRSNKRHENQEETAPPKVLIFFFFYSKFLDYIGWFNVTVIQSIALLGIWAFLFKGFCDF